MTKAERKNPCFGCSERHHSCWSDCPKYKEFKQKNEAEKRFRHSEKAKENECVTYNKKTSKRLKRWWDHK